MGEWGNKHPCSVTFSGSTLTHYNIRLHFLRSKASTSKEVSHSPPGGRDEERAIAPWNNKNGAETIHNNQYYIIWPITNIKYWIWALK